MVTGTARGQINHFVHVGWTVGFAGAGMLTEETGLIIIILNSR